jgi:lipoprotein-anchoring transpeptidase ErfK/SrfK
MTGTPPNRRRAPGPGARLAIVFIGAVVVAVVLTAVAGVWSPDGPTLSGDGGGGATGSPAPAALDQADAPLPPIAVALVKRPTALRAKPGGRRVAQLQTKTKPWRSLTVLAIVGKRGNWLRVMAGQLPNGKTGWIDARDTEIVPIDYRIRIDLSERRIDVVRGDRVVRRIRTAVGEQGTPTPKGDFAVTDKIPFVNADSSYGCCAIALTAHQPKLSRAWKGGDVIAIHATPSQGSIGRSITHGCMRVPDADARWLLSRLPLGTQVSIRA